MKITPIIAVCGMSVLVVFCLLFLRPVPSIQPAKEVQLSDISDGKIKIIGNLGYPLGNCCTLEGQYYRPAGMSPHKFRVTKINNKEVAIPQDIEFTDIPYGLKFAIGNSYRITGYETIYVSYDNENAPPRDIRPGKYYLNPGFVVTKTDAELGTIAK